jgi:TRAP-type C4-dicarboxylate transport system permease small subunit
MDRTDHEAPAADWAPAPAPPPLVLRRTERALGALAAVALVGIVLLTCVDVVGRYLLNRPLTGAFELSEMAMGALVFASLPLVTLRRQQVTVDLLDWLVPGSWRTAQDVAASLVAALCVGVVAWRLWVKAAEMLANGETTAVLKIPMYPLVHAMALLSFLTAVVILAMTWLDTRSRIGRP